MTRRAALAASVAALLVAVLIAVSGGFVASAGGVRISARSWTVPAAAAAALLAGWLAAAKRARLVEVDLAWIGEAIEARGRAIAIGVALLTVLAAQSFATFSASGADASGYLSQAVMWSRLETRVADPLVALPGWPLGPGATAPLGWRPALEGGWQVPTYAPGLPWLMAIPHALAGIAGAVSLVTVGSGLAVWATGALAWRIGGGVAAVLASLLLATSPTFLVHAFQPMSDVPVTAAWALCWWLVAEDAAASAGVAAAVAALVRPNLAPLAVVPLIVVTVRSPRTRMMRAAVHFAAPVAAAGALIAWLQWRWYGSPLISGYGSAGELFSVANIVPNLRLYAAWLWQAEPAFVFAVVAAFAGRWGLATIGQQRRRFRDEGSVELRSTGDRSLTVGLLVFAVAVTWAYLLYAVFEVWTYVRFLLPAIAVVGALVSAGVARILRRMPTAWRGAATIVLLLAVAATGITTARVLGVFQISASMARAREAGEHLTGLLTSRSVLLAGEQSGSMRYMTGRPIVRWDTLDPDSLRATLTDLEARGYDVWWVLDQFEEPLVRARFAGVPEAALDRAPELEAGPLMRTRAWRISRRRGDD